MNRRLILLGAVAALLAAFVLADGQWPFPALTGPEMKDAAPEAPQASLATGGLKLNPLEGLAAQSFAAFHERPLFNPGRAPRPVEAPPPPPPLAPEEPPPPPVVEAPSGPNPEDFQLLAIAAGPKGRVAALRVNETGEVLYLREGQPVLNWNVLAVEDRKVTIGTPEASIELGLFETDATESEPGDAPELEPEPPSEPLPQNPSPISPGAEGAATKPN